MTKNPIIIALDVSSADQARAIVARLGDSVAIYKVGMELYAAEGMRIVQELIAAGKQVFLDLKLYDIGETVKRATAVIAQTGVRFLTVHGNNGVMRAAVEGRADAKLQLLAVTVLTSWDQQDVTEDGYACQLSELVGLRARNAMRAEVDGMICSARDAAAVRKIVGPHAVIVTPGVRSRGAASGDQKRVATPAEAIEAGANYVVIGRQVTRSEEPRSEVLRILEEISRQPVAP